MRERGEGEERKKYKWEKGEGKKKIEWEKGKKKERKKENEKKRDRKKILFSGQGKFFPVRQKNTTKVPKHTYFGPTLPLSIQTSRWRKRKRLLEKKAKIKNLKQILISSFFQFVTLIRQVGGRRNLARKTLIDKRFLI